MNGPAWESPVVLFDRQGSAQVFCNAREAAKWVEAIDVAAGEYECYDVDGYVVELAIDDDRVTFFRTDSKNESEAAERLYASYLSSSVPFPRSDLATMMRQSIEMEWARRWPRWPRWLDMRLHGSGPGK